MTVRQMINDLQNIREDLKDKKVLVETPNGLLLNAIIKFDRKKYTFGFKPEDINNIIISG